MRIQKMTAALRKMILLAVCCVMAVVCAVGVSASEQKLLIPDETANGSITLTFRSSANNQTVTGGSVYLYKVADVKNENGFTFVYTGPFSTLTGDDKDGANKDYYIGEGAALDAALASRLASLVTADDRVAAAEVGSGGVASFTNMSKEDGTTEPLKIGLYLITQGRTTPNYDSISPFLVTIPLRVTAEDGTESYSYNIDASPKMGTVVTPTPPTPTPTPATATVTANKSVVDTTPNANVITELSEGTYFDFTLTRGASSNPMPGGVNQDTVTTRVTSTGDFSFGTITFTAPGTYTYTIQEVPNTNNYYTYADAQYYHYSTDVYTVTYTVVENAATNSLVVSNTAISPNSSITFVNPKDVRPVDVPVSVWKIVRDSSRTGQEITEIPADNYFDFTFTRNAATNPMPGGATSDSVTVRLTGATGLVNIGTIRFTTPGEYSYTVTEVPNTNSHYTYAEAEHYEYSTESHTVTYTVEASDDNTQMVVTRVVIDGAEVSNPSAYNMTFTNVYYLPTPSGNKGDVSTPLVVRKLVTDATRSKNKIKTIKADNYFDFVISRESGTSYPMPGGASGDTVMVRVTASDYNSGDGTKSAGSITFKAAGTYTYTVKEVKNVNKHYDFDDVDQFDFSDEEYTLTYVVGSSADGEKLVIESITISKDGTQIYQGTDPYAFSILFSNVYHEKQPSGSITPTPTTTTTPTPTPTTPNGGGGGGGGSSRLPQTGQLWWPVWLLCAAGVILLLSGFLTRRNRK